MKGNEEAIGVLAHSDGFKDLPHYHLRYFIHLFNLSFTVSHQLGLSFSLPPQPPHVLNPLLSSHQINNAEDDALARHLYLPVRLRPPKIRNSPLI